jgi:hypothetical protein
MKHENKPYGNIPSASSPKAIVIKQKIILRWGNSELDNIDEA